MEPIKEREIIKDVEFMTDHFTGKTVTLKARVRQKLCKNGKWRDSEILGPINEE
tara:strand:- start:17836 stop:17997 length:162 start_codon:yes stop_codon:yes gene_type:complete